MITLSNPWKGYFSIQISWTATTNVEYYKLFWSTSSGVTESSNLAGKIFSFTDFVKLSLDINTTYYFKVWAYDKTDIVLDFSNELNVATNNHILPYPDTESIGALSAVIKFKMYAQKKVKIAGTDQIIVWDKDYFAGDEWITIQTNCDVSDIYWRDDNRHPHNVGYDPTGSTGQKLVGTRKVGVPVNDPETNLPRLYLDETQGLIPLLLSLIPLPISVAVKPAQGGSIPVPSESPGETEGAITKIDLPLNDAMVEITSQPKKPEIKMAPLTIPFSNLIRLPATVAGLPFPPFLTPYPDPTKGEIAIPPVPAPPLGVPYTGVPNVDLKGNFILFPSYSTEIIARIDTIKANELPSVFLHPFSIQPTIPPGPASELPIISDSTTIVKSIENQKKFIYPPFWDKTKIVLELKIVLENKMGTGWKVVYAPKGSDPTDPNVWLDWIDIDIVVPLPPETYSYECLTKTQNITDITMFSTVRKISFVFPPAIQ